MPPAVDDRTAGLLRALRSLERQGHSRRAIARTLRINESELNRLRKIRGALPRPAPQQEDGRA